MHGVELRDLYNPIILLKFAINWEIFPVKISVSDVPESASNGY